MAIKIAVDAMGGDNAPYEIVKGAVEAAEEFGCEIILVGQQEAIKSELDKYKFNPGQITIENATEVISTEESPTIAIRKKKDSSIVVGLNLVKDGKASAFVSAGSTGAVLTGATFIIGRIKGIERPALGTCIPTIKGKFAFMIDSGANVDCKPNYLFQFAKMASVYVKYVMNVENPTVGLLNIGVEKEKGNALTKEVYGLLEQSNLNFTGNIEARDITYGAADIVVCDGFDGNIALKVAEGLAGVMLKVIKSEITQGFYKLAAFVLIKKFRNVKKRFDSEEVGGAPFLGLKALVVKAHGSSKAKGIKNAIKQCKIFVENDIVKKIEEQL